MSTSSELGRWKVRKVIGDTVWVAYLVGTGHRGTIFTTHAEALAWATNPIARLEHWLANQPTTKGN